MIISLVNQALVTMNVIQLLINLPIFDMIFLEILHFWKLFWLEEYQEHKISRLSRHISFNLSSKSSPQYLVSLL